MHRPDRAAQLLASMVTVREGAVVVAGRAPSPMDRWDTVRVPRSVIRECEQTADLPVVDEEMVRAAAGTPASDRLAAKPA